MRRSGYAQDTKKYDFTDILLPLKSEIPGKTAGVFLENLVMNDTKVSSVVAPPEVAAMLERAGFHIAFCGFSKAWDKAERGIQVTVNSLQALGITPVGLVAERDSGNVRMIEADGIRIALCAYTDTVAANTRKTLKKKDAEYMIPAADPDLIRADIESARENGAGAVVVLLNWGKVGSKNPEKSQMQLAQTIADLGADLIIGSGSRVPQRVDLLRSQDGREVFCAYSLGTLISDSRKSAGRMGGFLLHAYLAQDGAGRVSVDKLTCTPTYVWKFRQDSKDYYRAVAADRPAPDGMDADQSRQMQKTLSAVQEALADSQVALR